MASPVVTGIAGLVWSVNPDLTGKDVKRIVCESTSETVLPSEERYFDSLGYQAYPMVNAKLSVENALKETGEFFDVTVSANAKEEITITDEAGNEFVFEANPQGVLTCVLKNGSYIIETETVTKEITVNGETEIVL